MREQTVNKQGAIEFEDIVTIDIDCMFTEKISLDRTREEYVDPSGYTSIAKDVDGNAFRVCDRGVINS